MCSDCFGEDDVVSADMAFPPGQLAATARRIESDMTGEPVPSAAWDIYFGAESGAVGWRDMERMARCVEAARVFLTL